MSYDQTQKGWRLYLSFERVRNGYQTGLPGHTEQMRRLANRSIRG